MLSDNIRKYRKSKQMSQDELAEKLEVTRQSISLWETGQTQPSLDNIVALAKLFDISTDALLRDNEHTVADSDATALPVAESSKGKKKSALIVTICLLVIAALVATMIFSFSSDNSNTEKNDISSVTQSDDSSDSHQSGENDKAQPVTNDVEEKTQSTEVPQKEQENLSVPDNENKTPAVSVETEQPKEESTGTSVSEVVEEISSDNVKEDETTTVLNETTVNEDKSQNETVSEKTENVVDVPETDTKKDLYGYLKNFVIQNGIVNGDYCYYSNSADNYGGYESERFSLYYWGDTDKIEFCLHSVLDDVFSINFYLYVPEHHMGNYEYISSYYYRDTGEPLYEAKGVIKAAEFTKNYPLNCNKYIGSG